MILYKTDRSLICIWDDELRQLHSLTLLENGQLLLETTTGSRRVLIEQADNHDWQQLTRQIEDEIASKKPVWRSSGFVVSAIVATIAVSLILGGIVSMYRLLEKPAHPVQPEAVQMLDLTPPMDKPPMDKPEKLVQVPNLKQQKASLYPQRYEQIDEGEDEAFNPLETDQINAGDDVLFGGGDRNCVFESQNNK